MSRIDLHIHSCYSSDGELTPSEIVALAKAQNMSLISITDHNSVRAVPEALAAAGGLTVLPGVELDCTYGGKGFHLLGYGFDHTREEFLAIEDELLRQEQAAGVQKIRLFRETTGLGVDTDEVLSAAPNGVVTGELIAELLLAREDANQSPLLLPYLPGGEKSDMPNVRFYWDFFSEGKAAYVPIHYISLPDAVALIHRAGGISVLAHPGQNLAGDDTQLPGILSCGVAGIEAFSSYHNADAAAHYLKVAEQNNLLVTCGSDFHGKHKPNITLGGHGAAWNDEKLMAGLAPWLSGWA